MSNLKIYRNNQTIVLTDEEELVAYKHVLSKFGYERLECYINLAKAQDRKGHLKLAKKVMKDSKKCLFIEEEMISEMEGLLDDYYFETIEEKLDMIKEWQ